MPKLPRRCLEDPPLPSEVIEKCCSSKVALLKPFLAHQPRGSGKSFSLSASISLNDIKKSYLQETALGIQ